MNNRIGITIMPIAFESRAPLDVQKLLPKYPGAKGFGEIIQHRIPTPDPVFFIVKANGKTDKSQDELILGKFPAELQTIAKALFTRTLSDFLTSPMTITDRSDE